MTTLTPEQIVLREEIRQKYIKIQTERFSDERINNIVGFVWTHLGYEKPKVIVCDSPFDCLVRSSVDYPDIEFQSYWNIWLTSYAATYEFAVAIGHKFPEDNYAEFVEWAKCCPYVLFGDDVVYVSRRPSELHIDESDRLHREDGPAILYADGWSIYAMNGVHLNKQIVMHPETQTVEDIRGETNEEVKRIRIGRYGWEKYLNLINATLVDERVNDIEGTKEFLFASVVERITALMCICPSTGKEFILEVPMTCDTCRAAQSWLSSGLSERIMNAS
jgi:hypothetical protein